MAACDTEDSASSTAAARMMVMVLIKKKLGYAGKGELTLWSDEAECTLFRLLASSVFELLLGIGASCEV
jgi:hypothetical protein